MARTGTPPKSDAAKERERDEIDRLPPAQRPWKKPWQGPFLKALSTIPDIAAAVRVSGVGRRTAYRYRENDPDFAAAWDEALEIARDGIQQIAWQWATTGVPVKSVRTTTKRNAAGEIVTTETVETLSSERSSTLMIFWLKAWYPDRYRWVERVGVGGDPDADPVTVRSLSDIDREIAELSAQLAANGNGEPVPVE